MWRTETPDARPDIARVGSQALQGRRRAAHEHAVDGGLMSKREGAQFPRQRTRDEIVRARQELRPLGLEPALGPSAVAFRAVAITARVIPVDRLAAVITLGELATEVRSPARREIPKDSRLTGEQTVPHVGAIRCAVEADDLRDLEHAGLPIRGRA